MSLPEPWRPGLAGLAAGAVLLTAGCEQPADYYPGYVEGEYLHIATPGAGELQQLPVTRGDRVQEKDLLFEVERERERAALDEAEHRLQQAQANYTDLTKGKRPEEIAVIRAQLAQARADAELATSRLTRSRKLYEKQAISRDDLDAARTRHASARARVEELEASLATAGLAARSDALAAAEQEYKAAEAAVAQARWAYEQKAPTAPGDALVHDHYFQAGEWVPAGAAVVSLLPPDNRLIRFFVPETVVSTLHPGQQVEIRCDACGNPIKAGIDFIANEAEYTPPVIYSRDQRARLVFRAEARPAAEDATRLPPGLPVEVYLPGPPAKP